MSLALVLLALCLVAALVKVGDNDRSTGGGSGDSSGGSSTSYSWIDPQLGIDIFAYPNLLTLSEGEDCTITCDGSIFEGGVATLHADGSIDIPASVESLDSFEISLGEYTLQSNCVYYFYYAYEIGGEYERCGLGYEDTTGDGAYDIDFDVSGGGEVFGYGMYEVYDDTATFTLHVTNGLDGTMNSVNSGTFFLRVIGVPK